MEVAKVRARFARGRAGSRRNPACCELGARRAAQGGPPRPLGLRSPAYAPTSHRWAIPTRSRWRRMALRPDGRRSRRRAQVEPAASARAARHQSPPAARPTARPARAAVSERAWSAYRDEPAHHSLVRATSTAPVVLSPRRAARWRWPSDAHPIQSCRRPGARGVLLRCSRSGAHAPRAPCCAARVRRAAHVHRAPARAGRTTAAACGGLGALYLRSSRRHASCRPVRCVALATARPTGSAERAARRPRRARRLRSRPSARRLSLTRRRAAGAGGDAARRWRRPAGSVPRHRPVGHLVDAGRVPHRTHAAVVWPPRSRRPAVPGARAPM